MGQGSEFQVTYVIFKSISECFTLMWTQGWAKCLNYKSHRQHLKAFQLNEEFEKAWKSPQNSEMSRLWQELQCKERFENTQERTQEEEDNPRT